MNPVVKRTIAALTTAALVVCAMVFVPFKFALPVAILLAALVQLEFYQMIARKHETIAWLGVGMGLVMLCGTFYADAGSRNIAALLLGCGFAVSWLVALFGRYRSPLVALGTTWLGIIYIPLMLTFFIMTAKCHGMLMLLYIVAIVKFSDMGGFAVGMAFGKHKMCPTISPKKSWEGMAGSIVGSVMMSLTFIPITGFVWWKAAAFGVVAAIVGTLGDLVESRFKRECEVKDSATFMPAGMGGFLDMFDSLIFAPAVLLPFI